VILRNSVHEHVFAPRLRIHEVLCGGCFDVMVSAAQPMIAAAESAGIECSREALQRALSDGTIMLYVQEVLTSFN
jgi:hypothetical protein